MFRLFRFGCTFALFFACTKSGDLRAATVFDNGAPDQVNGFGLTTWIQANNFTVSTGILVNNIQFWDNEFPGYFQTSVLWEIHADNNGNVGSLLFSGTSLSLTHTATGRVEYSGAFPEYVSTFNIAQAALGAGTYWLVLHNGPLSNNGFENVYWGTATNPSAIETREIKTPFTDPWDTNGSHSQMAFKLNGTAGPRITAFSYHSATPQISFTTISGQRYSVQYVNQISTNNTWLTLSGAENLAGTGGTVVVTDLSLGSLKRRFYRAILLP